jgi:hypothetical protein
MDGGFRNLTALSNTGLIHPGHEANHIHRRFTAALSYADIVDRIPRVPG